MSRVLHKSWQSDRPLQPGSRRVKWYEGSDFQGGDCDIRLEFLTPTEKFSQYYTFREDAQADYEAFIAGTLLVTS